MVGFCYGVLAFQRCEWQVRTPEGLAWAGLLTKNRGVAL
jgi:hypothetical protein